MADAPAYPSQDATTSTYDARTTALVLVDVFNEFFADDGKINPMIRPMFDKPSTVESLTRLVQGARGWPDNHLCAARPGQAHLR